MDFHDIDFMETDKNNELSIEKYFKFWKIKTTHDKLNFLLDYGGWDIPKE